MDQCTEYLRQLLGNEVNLFPYEKEQSLPPYLTEKYDLYLLNIQNEEGQYILAAPIQNLEIRIEPIKKQLSQIQKYTSLIPALVFSHLRLSQRNALIQAKIPFIVAGSQVFLPGILLNLNETESIEKTFGAQFSVSTQVVYIYLLLQDLRETNARKLTQVLPYSSATMNRALAELVFRGLLSTEGSNTRKKYIRIEKKEYWECGKVFLFSPVQKTYYIKGHQAPSGMLKSNETALSELSSLACGAWPLHYAVSKNDLQRMPASCFQDPEELFDDDYTEIEVFRYDPRVLSEKEYIDPVSLYAQFKDNADDRIRISLDEVIRPVL